MRGVRGPYRGAILLVPEFPWPATSGGRVRASNLARALADLGPVTVLAPDSPGEANPDARWVAAGHRHQRRRASPPVRIFDITASIVLGRHVVVQRAARAGVADALRAIASDLRPSVIVLGRPFLGPFVDAAKAAGAAVIAEVDESFDKVSRSVLRSDVGFRKRFRALFDLMSARRLEARDLRRVDQVWVSSPIEAASLRRMSGSVPVAVVRSGGPKWPDVVPTAPDPRALAFIGYYAHPPNSAAAAELIESILPAVRAAGGPQELVLIGREPTRYMLRAAARDPHITVTGTVSDPAVSLREAGVLVMPIRSGAGTRIKALEAIGAGVPIISTTFGVEGLDLRPGTDFLLAETPREFADALDQLQDSDRRQAIAASAFERAQATQSPAAVASAVRLALVEVGISV